MEKQLTIRVPYNTGEEGLTTACKKGELFRNESELEKLYKQGYRVHNYSILDESSKNNDSRQTVVKVFLIK